MGLSPTGIVLIMLFVARLITETLSLSEFGTYPEGWVRDSGNITVTNSPGIEASVVLKVAVLVTVDEVEGPCDACVRILLTIPDEPGGRHVREGTSVIQWPPSRIT